MAASTAFIGMGVLLKIGDADPGTVFTEVAELQSLSGPSMSRGVADATHTTSPNNHREFLAAIADGGEIQASFNWIPANAGQVAALASFQNGTKLGWNLLHADSGAALLAFSAIITAWGWDAPLDGTVKVNLTLKVSGKPTVTP